MTHKAYQDKLKLDFRVYRFYNYIKSCREAWELHPQIRDQLIEDISAYIDEIEKWKKDNLT